VLEDDRLAFRVTGGTGTGKVFEHGGHNEVERLFCDGLEEYIAAQ
jgi:hypothetical protein